VQEKKVDHTQLQFAQHQLKAMSKELETVTLAVQTQAASAQEMEALLQTSTSKREEQVNHHSQGLLVFKIFDCVCARVCAFR
jgi:hypothetical protein